MTFGWSPEDMNMGFFSYECKYCRNPLLGIYAISERNEWMNEAVAVMKDGRVVRGAYDGYGVIGSEEIRNDDECKYDVYPVERKTSSLRWRM
jgi:hypothetical protein